MVLAPANMTCVNVNRDHMGIALSDPLDTSKDGEVSLATPQISLKRGLKVLDWTVSRQSEQK